MTDVMGAGATGSGVGSTGVIGSGERTEQIEIHDPADGQLVGRLATASPQDVTGAVDAARSAQRAWARTPAEQRGAALREAAQRLRARADELAASNEAETGRPRDEAVEGVLAGAGTLEQYAELGPVHRGRSLHGDWLASDLMVPEPRGVAVALTPWNDPVAVACGLLGAALAVGNAVIHKPSERCPHTGALLGEILAAELPENVFTSLVGDGEVGARLTEHPGVDVIAHVGSTATGRAIAAAAAGTGAKVLLENGGNDPLIVDDGVDPEWAATQAATGAFANSGQICVAVERIYVHRDVCERFLEALEVQANRYVHTPRRGTDVRLAPLVDRRARAQVHEQVSDAVHQGAQLRAGGTLPDGPGAHYPATVLAECTPAMPVLREETFGPVAPVRVVEDFEQGLAEAAEDRYGLAATVLTPDMRHAQQACAELPVGAVKVNAVFGGAPGGAAQPRRASGMGFGYGPELLDEMTTMKLVHIEPPGAS